MAIGIKGKSQTQQRQPDNQRQREKPPVDHGAKVKDSLLEDDEDELDSVENAKKLGIIAAVVVVVIIAAFIIVPKIGSIGDGSDDPVVVEEEEMVYDPEVEPEDEPEDYTEDDSYPEDEQESSFVTGDNDYASGNMQITADISDAQDFVYDLEGAEVPVDYKVRNTEYVTAHVNYAAKRAIIDQGMEMYWVDVEYKDRHYRAQCPFYYFKELDNEGICRVEIEVLNLEDGGQIISYMQIIPENDGTE